MYTDWFKLGRLPFRLRPDPEFLFAAGPLSRALEGLRTALTHSAGTITVVGEAGVGKTSVLHLLAQDAGSNVPLARLQLPSLTPQELLDALAAQFGAAEPDAAIPTTARQLRHYFAELAGQGRRAVVLVDDAHHMPEASLRELLKLTSRQPAPLVILAGEPMLRNAVLALYTQSKATLPHRSYRLQRLEPALTRDYIQERLRIAGGDGRQLFDADALTQIQRYTGGTPKLINILCDRAMALAETHSNPRVLSSDVRDAVQDLKWVEFRAPVETAEPDPGSTTVLPEQALELQVHFRGELVTRRRLEPGQIIVGRGEEADLRLHSNLVSRQHCLIVTTGRQSIVEDLGSTNGLVVNGRRLRVHQLLPNDTIVVGEHLLTCRECSAP